MADPWDVSDHRFSHIERTGEQIRKFFAELRPVVSFSVADRNWTVKLGVADAENAGKHVQFLVDALDGLEKLARTQPHTRAIGLVIDEYALKTRSLPSGS